MMGNELVVREIDFDTLQRQALALQASGYFKDGRDPLSKAQAITKVLAGAELGLPPFASMAGLHIIQGKPVLGSNLIATLVKNSGRYDYRVKQCDNEACVIEWFEDGESVGEAGFTMEEAKAAQLTGKDNWQKYPSDMLFARAVSRGARRFAPGVFGGAPIYSPDEMGADEDGNIMSVTGPEDVDSDTGEILEGDIVEDEAPVSDNGSDAPPDDSDEIKKFHRTAADKIGYFKGPKHVKATMNLLGIKYPETTEEAETALAMLKQYGNMRADGTEQEQAVKLLQGELALSQEA